MATPSPAWGWDDSGRSATGGRPADRPRPDVASPPDLTPTQVRLLAVVGLVAEVGLMAWETQGEWGIAAPALLLIHLIGLLGFGLYRLVARRWRQRAAYEELFVSSGLFAALVTLGVTYAAGEWMGVRSVLGSLTGGIVVGITLVLGRLAIRGPVRKEAPPAARFSDRR